MKMDVLRSLETLIPTHQTALYQNSEHGITVLHRRQDLKPYSGKYISRFCEYEMLYLWNNRY